jgi:hypothetical protein
LCYLKNAKVSAITAIAKITAKTVMNAGLIPELNKMGIGPKKNMKTPPVVAVTKAVAMRSTEPTMIKPIPAIKSLSAGVASSKLPLIGCLFP